MDWNGGTREQRGLQGCQWWIKEMGRSGPFNGCNPSPSREPQRRSSLLEWLALSGPNAEDWCFSLSLARTPCHSLLCSSLSRTLSQADHIIFLNTLSHYRAHFLSVNISNLIWHRNSNFSFSLNRPFPLQPGGLRQRHLR